MARFITRHRFYLYCNNVKQSNAWQIPLGEVRFQ